MLKISELIKDHWYVSKEPQVKHGILTKRHIIKVHPVEGYVTYCEIKGLKRGAMATMKTISIPSFLRWAGADITQEEAM